MCSDTLPIDIVDDVLQRVMNARQFGLKLIANVTYGYTSAGFSGRMPMAEIADSIVQVGSCTADAAALSYPPYATHMLLPQLSKILTDDVYIAYVISFVVRMPGRFCSAAAALCKLPVAKLSASKTGCTAVSKRDSGECHPHG